MRPPAAATAAGGDGGRTTRAAARDGRRAYFEKYRLDEAATEKLAERIPFPEQAARELAFDLSVAQGSGKSSSLTTPLHG